MYFNNLQQSLWVTKFSPRNYETRVYRTRSVKHCFRYVPISPLVIIILTKKIITSLKSKWKDKNPTDILKMIVTYYRWKKDYSFNFFFFNIVKIWYLNIDTWSRFLGCAKCGFYKQFHMNVNIKLIHPT